MPAAVYQHVKNLIKELSPNEKARLRRALMPRRPNEKKGVVSENDPWENFLAIAAQINARPGASMTEEIQRMRR